MTELLNFLLGLSVLVILGLVVWESAKMVDEKNKRRRK